MKPKLLYTIILLLNFTTFVIYSQDYYWYDDAKIHLTIGDKEYIVYEPHTTSPNNATGLLYEEDIVASNQQMLKMGIIAKGTNLDIGRIVYRITSYISNEEIFTTCIPKILHYHFYDDSYSFCTKYSLWRFLFSCTILSFYGVLYWSYSHPRTRD